MQKKLLRIILGLGLLLIPFAFKKEKLKDWLLIFFLKGYISSFLDQIIVKKKRISYPVRFMSKYFDSSLLFDYLLFPLLCVFYNRTSEKSNLHSIFLQSLIYTTPITVLEVILEKKTNLIRYKKNWNWLITYSTLVVTFLFVRGFIAIIRKLNIENPPIQNK
ncbi:MAG: CBO0543 family protein [Bacillus sp. (in: firmicutes)]